MKKPKFKAGRNIAMKIPPHEYNHTLIFYRDVLGFEIDDALGPGVAFIFGDKRLWLDKVETLSQSEIWLEITSDDLNAASEYFNKVGVVRQDDIEILPEDFEGFWIISAAGIVHLVTK